MQTGGDKPENSELWKKEEKCNKPNKHAIL